MGLEYGSIEQGLTAALPEISPAAEEYWRVEGEQGPDCGPYIFFGSVLGPYLSVLLAMNSSPRRDQLLSRAFAFVEQMLASTDPEVANLAYVEMLEWQAPWWYVQAGPHLGPCARAALDRFFGEWRVSMSAGARPTDEEKLGIIDLYGVRRVIAAELAAEGVTLDAVPGVTHMKAE